MNRYLLDTNIIVFLILGETDDVSKDVSSILEDYSNLLYTDTIVISEILQLVRIGKLKLPKKYKNGNMKIIRAIENDFRIEIKPYTRQHSETLAGLNIPDDHNDPFDHAIIAHTIAEKLVLISSDTQFEQYTKQKLKFVFNERYFRTQLAEIALYREIGSWWEAKEDANEIDIVAISLEKNKALAIEVKRQKKHFRSTIFTEKVERLQQIVLPKYKIERLCLSLEDM
jgi:PIN domain nuclease of toxin-antitoxin system